MIKNLKKYDPEHHKKELEKKREEERLHEELVHELDDNDDFIKIKKRHPHIAIQIEKNWGTNKLHEYIVNLFEDTRGGTRKGFEEYIYHSLLEILNFHDKAHPHLEKPSKLKTVWTTIIY